MIFSYFFFFFQAEDGIRDKLVTGVQTCALPISRIRQPSAQQAPGSFHAANATEGEHAVEPVLPGSQHREAGASWICNVGTESREIIDRPELPLRLLSKMMPTSSPQLLTRHRSCGKRVFLQLR